MNKNFKKWIEQGVPIFYVRFQSPVAPYQDKEPVSEFRLQAKHDKYVVEEMYYTPFGVIWKFKDEWDISAPSNIQYARVIDGD